MDRYSEAFERMVDLRVKNSSKKNYKAKLNRIKIFLLEKYPEVVDNQNEIIVPMSEDVTMKLFGWLSSNKELAKKGRSRAQLQVEVDVEIENDNLSDSSEDSDGEVDIFAERSVTIASNTMQGYKSALVWYYKEKKVDFPVSLGQTIDNFITGYKKQIADKKLNGVMKTSEGKLPLSFTSYSDICFHLATLKPTGRKSPFNEGIFGWSFMVLCWNMIARSISVSSLMLEHFGWVDDCTTVTVAKHKGDQTGEGLSNMKHVYANPTKPHICPILSLAIYIWCTQRNAQENHRLYSGKPEGRFSKILKQILINLPEEHHLCADIKDIGTHSNRKGAGTYVLSLCGMSAVQVYLRAGTFT
jgi:hypothetical protein